MKPDREAEVSATKAEQDKGRREALKKFGKLAAAASAAMVLLGPRPSVAVEVPDQYER